MEDLRQLRRSELTDIALFTEGGCGGNKFEWQGEIVCKLKSAKDEQALVGAYPAFAWELTFYRARYSVTCLCMDDQLTIVDEDLEKLDLKSMKEESLALPPAFKPGAKADIFNNQPFFKTVQKEIKVTEVKEHAEVKGTCGIFRLGLTLTIPPDLRVPLPRDGGGGFGIPVEDKQYVARVKSAFKVCCCTSEAENDKPPVCSWSSKCLVFDNVVREGVFKRSVTELSVELNGTVGGCGHAAWKKKLSGFV
jgi:hypothetical protein